MRYTSLSGDALQVVVFMYVEHGSSGGIKP